MADNVICGVTNFEVKRVLRKADGKRHLFPDTRGLLGDRRSELVEFMTEYLKKKVIRYFFEYLITFLRMHLEFAISCFLKVCNNLLFYNRLFQLAVYLIFFALHLAHFDIFSAFDVFFTISRARLSCGFYPELLSTVNTNFPSLTSCIFLNFIIGFFTLKIFFDSADTPAIQFERILANSIFV